MNLREWLAQAEAQLSTGPHPDRARLDAETLLLHLIGKNKAWLMAHADDDFAGCTAIRFASLLKRRRKGEPIQYITGETEFYGLPFRVTPDVLIPRPETEHLVEKSVGLATVFDKPRIVDIGTGSGVIPVSLAHKLPESQITAIDISGAALSVAEENGRRNGVDIRFLEGDLLAPVAEERFEIIVSNPPYVAAVDRDSLSIEVRDYEPALALFAGDDGLSIYLHLIPQAFAALVPGGFIALEIGYGQQPAIHSLLATAGFIDIQFTPDLQGIP
ncbi:MAG: peptide chain release factor N(5)-glutamine methyltransferase, partial [Terracidiphilus sp.]